MAKVMAESPVATAAPATIEDIQEIDEMEAELNESTGATPPAAENKKEKKVREPKIAEGQIGVAALAAQLGVTGRELRMYLRKHNRNMADDKGKTYVWNKTDPVVQEIIDGFTAAKAAPRKKAEKVDKEAATTETAAPTVPEVDLDDLDADDLE